MMCRWFAWLALVLGAVAVRGQTAALTANTAALAAGGGQITFSVTVSFSGSPAIFLLEVASPPDWTYVSGASEPPIKPVVGSRAAPGSPFGWTSFTRLSSPVQFSFVLSYPAGATSASVPSAVTLRQLVQVTVTDKATGVQTTETRDVRTDLVPPTLGFGMPPTISIQPAGATVAVGSATTLSVTASGSAPLRYQWYKSGTVVTGATSSMLAFASVVPADAGSYAVLVSNGIGSLASVNAVLSVTTTSGGGGGGSAGG